MCQSLAARCSIALQNFDVCLRPFLSGRCMGSAFGAVAEYCSWSFSSRVYGGGGQDLAGVRMDLWRMGTLYSNPFARSTSFLLAPFSFSACFHEVAAAHGKPLPLAAALGDDVWSRGLVMISRPPH